MGEAGEGVTIQAIETRYKGYRFRSRLEARWAVFFDELGVPWEYEKQGFELDGVYYLPDFWLPHLGFWVEVKGDKHCGEEDWIKIFRMARRNESWVLVLAGGIGSQECTLASPKPPDADWLKMMPAIAEEACTVYDDVQWSICPRCERLGVGVEMEWDNGIARKLAIICLYCYADNVRVNARLERHDPRTVKPLQEAYDAARAARFEHGETPKARRAENRKR